MWRLLDEIIELRFDLAFAAVSWRGNSLYNVST